MEQTGQIIPPTKERVDGPNVTGETISTKRAAEVGSTNELDLSNFPALTSNINTGKSPKRKSGVHHSPHDKVSEVVSNYQMNWLFWNVRGK